MEHFIETVHKYPCLWNTTAIEYRDQELKDAAWTEVMKETDLSSVKEVKLKWKKLRDSYRDALKRQSEMLSKEPGNAARRACPWKYMGLMQFLQPYMSNRKKAGESPPRYPAVPPPSPPGNGHAVSSSESESEAESEPPRRKGSDRLSLHDTKPQYPRLGRASKRAAERTPPPSRAGPSGSPGHVLRRHVPEHEEVPVPHADQDQKEPVRRCHRGGRVTTGGAAELREPVGSRPPALLFQQRFPHGPGLLSASC